VPQAGDEPDPDLRITGRPERPLQRGPQVVALVVQPGQPRSRSRAEQVPLGLLNPREVVTSVPFPQFDELSVGQVPPGELTGGLQQAIACRRALAGAVLALNRAADHQTREQQHDIVTEHFSASGHRHRRFQVESRGENGNLRKEHPLGFGQQVIAPRHGCRQAAMARVGSPYCGVE